jgi:hypothetical protein
MMQRRAARLVAATLVFWPRVRCCRRRKSGRKVCLLPIRQSPGHIEVRRHRQPPRRALAHRQDRRAQSVLSQALAGGPSRPAT